MAMLGVICLHCCIGRLDNPIAFVMSRLSGISIPLFFMVSGYLLVEKDGSYNYSLKKILGIIKFVFIITISYWFLYSFLNGFDLNKLLTFFLYSFVQKGPFWMFWYFGAMCLVYLLLPILLSCKRIVSNFFLKLLAFLICIDFVIFVLTLQVHLEYNVTQCFRLWNWLTFFTIGALIKEHLFAVKGLLKYNILLCVVSALLFISFVYYCRFVIDGVEYFFTTPLCMLYAFSVFLTIASVNIKYNKIIDELSKLFLPVYSLHYFVIIFYRKFLYIPSWVFISPFFDWIIISIMTLFISYLLMRIPVMKKIFII